MKKFIILFVMMFLVVSNVVSQKMVPRYNRLTNTWTAYPEVTIRYIQEVPLDSLLLADAAQTAPPGRVTMQYSPRVGETLTVVAVCVVPGRILNFTQRGFTMVLYDTGANPAPWGAIFVRSTSDTAQHVADGFMNVERGDVIRMTGRVEEFPALPTLTLNTVTQFAPIPGISIDIIGSQAIPPPIPKNVSDFYVGLFPGGQVKFSTGEPYESFIVEMTNLTVVSHLNTLRGTFNAVQGGNMISDYDASTWFTIRPPEGDPPYNYRHPNATYQLPPIGTIIDTLRGYMTTVSGGENPRGYRISPVWDGEPEDHYILGNIKVSISDVVRNPMLVEPTSTPLISARVTRGTFEISEVLVWRSVDWGPFTPDTMNYDAVDSLYKVTLPSLPEGSFVRYFIRAVDANNDVVIKASYATGGADIDTSKGFFFYTVKSPPLTIYDVQYTPFPNGYSQYAGATFATGAVVTVGGIVTADSTDLLKIPRSTVGGTWAYYMQSGNQPWSGIWITGPDSIMRVLKKGDSVSVTGTVQEWASFGVNVTTRIAGITNVVIHSSGNPIPEPVSKPTGHFGPAAINGSPLAEPYEGMLVKFSNVTVTDVWPYYADNSQYEIDDGTGGVWVHRDGTNNFSNRPGDVVEGFNILYVGDKISEVTGIIHFSVHRYKFVPRSNSDFGYIGGGYNVAHRWNLMSLPRLAFGFDKSKLYPTALTPAYRYTGTAYAPIVGDLEMGVGYWLKFPSAQEVLIPGARVSIDTVRVDIGWNLIGAVSNPISASSVISEPAGIIASPFYGYEIGYTPSSVLNPGKGYWVKSNDTGNIILGSTFFYQKRNDFAQNISRKNSIIIEDANGYRQTLFFGLDDNGKFPVDFYVMPPVPPSGTFDARFASQRIVEVYPWVSENGHEYPIILTSPKYPLTITWNIHEEDPNHTFSLEYSSSEAETDLQSIQSSGSLTLKKVFGNIITLKVNSGELPKEFSLGQNYPNPFNPSTKFTVALPKTAHVEIVVYDILGRKIRTILNEERPAGYHIVTWDGLSEEKFQVGSGVYFIRMNSEKFSAIRKVLMLK